MMNPRAWTLLLVLGTAALSGCVGDEPAEAPPADADEGLDDLDVDGNATVEAVLAPRLSADAVNGTAPLVVNLTLEADGADGNTTWSLDFGDGNATDGVGLPATVNHTYGVGNHTAVLSVGNETTSIDVTVLAGGPAPGTFLRDDVLEESGTLVTGVQWCGLEEGVDKATHTWDLVDVEADGTASTVSNVHVLLEMSGATNLDIDVAFIGPDGTVLGEGTAFNAQSGPTEEFEVAGPLGPGTYTFEVKSCSGAAQDYTLTATATYVAA